MSHRSDIREFFRISLTEFQAFDKGQIIEQSVPSRWNLFPGDTMEWEAGQFFGELEIITIGEVQGTSILCTVKKIS